VTSLTREGPHLQGIQRLRIRNRNRLLGLCESLASTQECCRCDEVREAERRERESERERERERERRKAVVCCARERRSANVERERGSTLGAPVRWSWGDTRAAACICLPSCER
jgi:hypothetical protein